MPLLSPATNSQNQTLFEECINEFKNQILNPPGNDVVIMSCYSALLPLLNDPVISQKLCQIVEERDYTPSHFANIFFRAIQFIELYHCGENHYPNKFDTIAKWEYELSNIFNTKFEILAEILLNKDTTTTIYQRYAGSKFILNSLFAGKEISVADLGCGGNYGLPGIIADKSFEPISDFTKNGIFTTLVSQKTQIFDALAIDKEDPYDAQSHRWRYSCSFYPHELKNAPPQLPVFDESETIFTRFDLTIADTKPEKYNIKLNSFDAVIMSTFLYQLSDAHVELALDFAKKILKDTGVIIIQDFAVLDKNAHNNFRLVSDWFSRPYPYRTFLLGASSDWVTKEILQWNNGRCRQVKEGKDFDFLLKQKSGSINQKGGYNIL